jgi:hypothetical protein
MSLSAATCPEVVEAIYLNWWQPGLLQRNSAACPPSVRVAKFNIFENAESRGDGWRPGGFNRPSAWSARASPIRQTPA